MSGSQPTAKGGKPRPLGRKRRAMGWGLIALALIVVFAIITSAWCSVGRQTSGGFYVLTAGKVTYVTMQPFPGQPIGWRFEQHAFRLEWPTQVASKQWSLKANWVIVGVLAIMVMPMGAAAPDMVIVDVALWPWVIAFGVPGVWLAWWSRRARRRAEAGRCVKCGYDVAGLAKDAVCPECGTARVMESKA